jgi:hypothetical protein
MADLSQIQPHMEIFGADGVRLGTVDSVEGGRVRLSANADTAPSSKRKPTAARSASRASSAGATSCGQAASGSI